MPGTLAASQHDPCSGAPPPHLISSRRRDERAADQTNPTVPVPSHRPGELFLKGPIPLSWLETASRCGGKALNVGLFLWQRAAMKKSGRISISLTRVGERMGFDRTTAYRALSSLEGAGLLAVERVPGRSPVVTLHWPTLVPPALPICKTKVE